MSLAKKTFLWHSLTWLCCLSFSVSAAESKEANAKETGHIVWKKWRVESFEQAKRENKMLLINVGIEVCFACRWMEQQTYSNSKVAKLITANFVPIQVDADSQPDIGERYSDWAWPATIFMAPDGTQVLALSGNRRPESFIPILEKLVSQQAKGELRADALAPYAATPAPETTELTKIRDKVRLQLDDDFDDKLGGWGDELKEINGSGKFNQLIIRAHAEGDRQAEQRFLKTAYAMTGRVDRVWGGFFSAGLNGWTAPILEKRTGSQATALEVFASAYHLTKDQRFLDAAKNVDRYMRSWMQAPDGTFYTSQTDSPPHLPKNWTLPQYFALNTDAKRRRYGVPPIDHAIYTDLNARVVVAYTKLYEATGEDAFLRTAEKCAKTLINDRQQTQGWMLQIKQSADASQDQRIHLQSTLPRPYLRTQAHFGVALLALYRVTGEQIWLKSAQQLGEGLRLNLEDREIGGFYAAVATEVNATIPRRKPLQENGVAARFLYQLGKYSKNTELIAAAERAIRAVSIPAMIKREGRIVGDLAVALETLTAEYVEFTVVGTIDQPQALRLFNTGRAYYEPRKLLHYELPGRYPDLGRPVMFICSQNACSVPIFESTEVAAQAEKFHRINQFKKYGNGAKWAENLGHQDLSYLWTQSELSGLGH